MKVICAGLPKTGTKSMAHALRVLGYNVHDIFEQYFLDRYLLDKVRHNTAETKDYQINFAGVDAVTDFPACGLWEEIHKAHPDAKVVLTVRSSEDEWIASVNHHCKEAQRHSITWKFGIPVAVENFLLGPLNSDYYQHCADFLPGCLGCKRLLETPVEALIRAKYRQHNAYVKATCPSDKLFVFNVKDGWEPLCKFLNLPAPVVSFPRVNVKSAIIGQMMSGAYDDLGLVETAKRQAITRLSIFGIAVLALLIFIFQ